MTVITCYNNNNNNNNNNEHRASLCICTEKKLHIMTMCGKQKNTGLYSGIVPTELVQKVASGGFS